MGRKKLPRVLTKEEAETLIEEGTNTRYWAPMRNRALLRLAFDTALRSSEIRHLRDAHLDLQSGRLVVRAEGAKGDWERTLWFPDETADLLARWLERRDEEVEGCDLVFPTRNGTMLAGRYLRSMIKRLAKKCGLPEADRINFHTARHSRLTWALEETGNLRLVQKMAGHQSIQNTTLYTRLADSELADAMRNGGTNGHDSGGSGSIINAGTVDALAGS